MVINRWVCSYYLIISIIICVVNDYFPTLFFRVFCDIQMKNHSLSWRKKQTKQKLFVTLKLIHPFIFQVSKLYRENRRNFSLRTATFFNISNLWWTGQIGGSALGKFVGSLSIPNIISFCICEMSTLTDLRRIYQDFNLYECFFII